MFEILLPINRDQNDRGDYEFIFGICIYCRLAILGRLDSSE